ncbi:MAG: exodeoxyribonuclease VII large subunit [Kangiellaceae bacterium]|nr:exodeoxyribonuclease VII large subunit [Kangiellaceae bacterium]
MIQPLLHPQKTIKEPTQQRKVYSVGELALKVRRQLESEIGQIWITGEISNLSTPGSGHWYFTLKDADAQLKCAIFRNRNRSARFTPQDGQQVLMRAKISLYEPRGDLQLIGEYIEPAGEGALQVAFNRLKQKLSNEGLFDQEHKRPIPTFPNKIGIITSPTGAAIKDVLTVLNRRMPQIPVLIYPSLVQGDKAAVNLMKQIEVANRDKQCDVLLITRGGGSLEDMWCFNDEHLARAIRSSDIPVVSAVGHEIDISISDLVADLRAPTPSAAAELLVPDQATLIHKLSVITRRLKNEFEHQLQVAQASLDKLSSRIVHPKQKLEQSRNLLRETTQELLIAYRDIANDKYAQLIELQYRLKGYKPRQELEYRKSQLAQTHKTLIKSFKELLKDKKQSVAFSAQQLNDLSPLATLGRGYTITEDENGKVLTSVKQAKKAKELTTRFVDGEIKSNPLN